MPLNYPPLYILVWASLTSLTVLTPGGNLLLLPSFLRCFCQPAFSCFCNNSSRDEISSHSSPLVATSALDRSLATDLTVLWLFTWQEYILLFYFIIDLCLSLLTSRKLRFTFWRSNGQIFSSSITIFTLRMTLAHWLNEQFTHAQLKNCEINITALSLIPPKVSAKFPLAVKKKRCVGHERVLYPWRDGTGTRSLFHWSRHILMRLGVTGSRLKWSYEFRSFVFSYVAKRIHLKIQN